MSRVSHCTVLINNCQLQRGCLSENSIKTVIVCKIKTPKYNAKLGINHMPGRKKKLSKWLSSRVKPKGMLNISNKLFFLQCLQAVCAKGLLKKGGKKAAALACTWTTQQHQEAISLHKNQNFNTKNEHLLLPRLLSSQSQSQTRTTEKPNQAPTCCDIGSPEES